MLEKCNFGIRDFEISFRLPHIVFFNLTTNMYEEFMDDFSKWQTLIQFSPNLPVEEISRETSNNLFLTGTTGFLGAFVLAELLKTTNYQIWCLVRATDAYSGLAKIRTNLEYMGIFNETSMNKIKVFTFLFCYYCILFS